LKTAPADNFPAATANKVLVGNARALRFADEDLLKALMPVENILFTNVKSWLILREFAARFLS